MGPVARLKERLSAHPDVPYQEDGVTLCVEAATPEGFDVAIEEIGDGSRVWCGQGRHEDFESDDDAVECFLRVLSRDCRLRVVSRGGSEYLWTLHRRDGDAWVRVSTVGLLWCRFWRRKQIRCLRNEWL